MAKIEVTSFSKKKNSTARPRDFDREFDVRIKQDCDWNNPTFILNTIDSEFPYNYVRWGRQYYFVSAVKYKANDLIEVSCETDVLATFKETILDSVQFVSYSNISGGQWLPDTRIPVLKSHTVAKNSIQLPFFNLAGGWYVISVIGKLGCQIFALNFSQIVRLLNSVSSDADDMITSEMASFTFDSVETALESLTKAMVNTDILGNAFSNAPSCIRSCMWIPFVIPDTFGTDTIYLGRFNTGVQAVRIDSKPLTGSISVSIPWQFADWRRATCEEVYLYLPLVGMINIDTTSITNETSITVNYSYTLSDGVVAYQITAGNQIIGSYGGSCSANYPIGINQPASVGEVITSMISGIQKTASVAAEAGLNVATATASGIATAVTSGYEIVNTAYSTHPTCIGGIGGGAGFGLDKNISCFTVAHPTIIEPSEMSSTMGVPTMKPLRLSSCSGYCQCVNAHVALSAHSDEIDAVDSFLNSGFYIE